MNKRNNFDLVKECVKLALAVVRLARKIIELLDMVINYHPTRKFSGFAF